MSLRSLIVLGVLQLAMVSSSAIAATANNDDVPTSTVPMFHQRLTFKLPADWQNSNRQRYEHTYVMEFIPSNETVDDWQNMVSLQAYKALASKVNGEQFLDYMQTTFATACSEYMVYEKLPLVFVEGYQSTSAIVGCGNITQTSEAENGTRQQTTSGEIGLFIAIQGKRDIYLLNKSMRTKPFVANDAPLTAANAQAFIEPLLPIALCQNLGMPWECVP